MVTAVEKLQTSRIADIHARLTDGHGRLLLVANAPEDPTLETTILLINSATPSQYTPFPPSVASNAWLSVALHQWSTDEAHSRPSSLASPDPPKTRR